MLIVIRRKLISFKPKTDRGSAASVAAPIGIHCDTWELGRGDGASIPKRHHRPALAADADARCGYTLN